MHRYNCILNKEWYYKLKMILIIKSLSLRFWKCQSVNPNFIVKTSTSVKNSLFVGFISYQTLLGYFMPKSVFASNYGFKLLMIIIRRNNNSFMYLFLMQVICTIIRLQMFQFYNDNFYNNSIIIISNWSNKCIDGTQTGSTTQGQIGWVSNSNERLTQYFPGLQNLNITTRYSLLFFNSIFNTESSLYIYIYIFKIEKIRENGFELTKKRSRRYPAKTITDVDYADDIAILANTPSKAETLQRSLERAAAGICPHVNAHKTEYMCYNQTGDISTVDGTLLKLVDKFPDLGSSVESTEKDIDTRQTKAWTAIDKLSIIWKSGLTDKIKRSFFQAAVVSILLYGCTTWTLTKRLEKKLDGNYTRVLRAILNKSWQQYPTRHQLYGHLPPITKTIKVRRTRHAGHCWRSRDELISDVLLWTRTYGRAKAGRPAWKYIEQLCEDTGGSPENLPEAMNNREKWRERVRDIRASGTWWWFKQCI